MPLYTPTPGSFLLLELYFPPQFAEVLPATLILIENPGGIFLLQRAETEGNLKESPFPSYLLPLLQNKSSWNTFRVKTSLIYMKMNL